jgi:L-fuculose-phosphate aldolase
VALTLDGEDFTPIDFEGAFYFPRVPVLDIAYEDYVDKAPGAVSDTLIENKIAVVRGHGVYAWGENLDRAYKWSCSLELSARTAYIARTAGTIID